MAVFPVRFNIVLVVGLTCLLVVIGLMNLKDRVTWKAPEDGVNWTDGPDGLQATAVEAGGPGDRAGIKVGDVLVRIDENPISGLKDHIITLYNLGAGSQATYVIKEASTGRTTSRQLNIESQSAFSPTDLCRVLVAFSYLFIGLYILLRSRATESLHFYVLCLISFVLYLFSYTTKLEPLDYVVYWSSSIALPLLPALFLDFCLSFPVKKEWIAKHTAWRYGLYLPFAMLLLVQVRWFAGKLAFVGLPRNLTIRVLLDRIHIAYYALFLSLGALALVHTLRTAKDPTTKQQMKWIGYGTVAAILPFTLLYALPYLYLGSVTNYYLQASILSLSLIPLCFGYAVIKYKLMDVDVIFKNGTAYVIASSIVLGLYFLLVVLAGKLGEWIAPEYGFTSIALSALAAAFLFAPLRNRVQVRIDQLFYKGEYAYRESLVEFGKTLSSEISLPRLSRLILERIRKTFDIEALILLLREDSNDNGYKVIDSIALRTNAHRLDSDDLDKLGLDYFQPLSIQGREIGLLGLGKKRNGNFFSNEDLELLEALSGYAAIALENAKLYRSVEAKAYEYARLKDYSENIIESINVGVIVLDLDGNITGCNSAFEQLYGVKRHVIVDKHIEEVFSNDFVRSVKKATGTPSWVFHQTKNLYKLFLDTQRNRGAIVNLSITPLIDRTDNINGTLVLFDNITERVQLENQLLQAEKLSSIGLLAAGIAHEINTPIAGISGYTQILLKQVKDTDPQKEILTKIEKQTFRASEIINSLLNFSRLNGSEFKPIRINDVIRETLSLLDHQFKNNHIRVQTELSELVPMTVGHSGKLQQVFVNLFLNARDAMPNGGEIRIVTSSHGPTVVVDVIDTGVGISEENLKRIYDPFFTTKDGRGTGLGLAVSYGIIQEHSGRIFVESTPGKGTHFTLKFPAQAS